MKACVSMIQEIWQQRKLLIQFARNDFKSRYAGSFLGILWAFVNPLVMVLTYWFVFSFALRAGASGEYPFIVFLLSGIVAWFFFSDVLGSATNVFREYSYLVKKVVFNIKILPTAKLISAFYTHLFFLGVTFVVLLFYGYTPTLQTLQLVYYIVALMLFVTGLTWVTSSIQPFFPDLNQLIAVIMQALMWSVPVLWNPIVFQDHPKVIQILKLNPMYYIVEGYRASLLSEGWFWQQHPAQTIYFWIVTVILMMLGAHLLMRLKPHFSDVL